MSDKKNRADYVTLRYIVEQYMLQKGETTIHNFIRYYQLAIKGFKRLNTDVAGSLEVCIKPLTAANTIKLPADFINYTRIGVVSGKAVAWLGRNESLIIDKCGAVIKEIAGIMPYYSYDGYYGDQEYISGGNYGLGGGNNVNGYYQVDYEKGTIAFDSVVSGKILLEYVSNGIDDKGEIFTHFFTEEAITAYIHWQNITYKNVPLGEKQLARQQFLDEEDLVSQRVNSFTQEEWIAAIRKGNIAAPKF